jgi:hypothetical protein
LPRSATPGRRGTLQILYGLLTDSAGRPVAVEVFDGATHDHQSVPAQLDKLKDRFGVAELVLVADRGMVTGANLDAIRQTDGVEWITALKARQVKRLARTGAFQPSLFDEHNFAEITSDDFPGERLVVGRNPLVAAERAQAPGAACGDRGRPGADRRTRRGRPADRRRPNRSRGPRGHQAPSRQEALHPADRRRPPHLPAQDRSDRAGGRPRRHLRPAHRRRRRPPRRARRRARLQQLKEVERDFRVLKGPQLDIRPIHHRLEHRVRAHVFLCTLALYVEWHLRQAWRELTFHDEHPPDRPYPVAKATRSPAADRKAATKTTTTGHATHTVRELLADLATRRATRSASPTTPPPSPRPPRPRRCRPARSSSPTPSPSSSHEPASANSAKTQRQSETRDELHGELRIKWPDRDQHRGVQRCGTSSVALGEVLGVGRDAGVAESSVRALREGRPACRTVTGMHHRTTLPAHPGTAWQPSPCSERWVCLGFGYPDALAYLPVSAVPSRAQLADRALARRLAGDHLRAVADRL